MDRAAFLAAYPLGFKDEHYEQCAWDAWQKGAAWAAASTAKELRRLSIEVFSWRNRGRGPMLHDPELKPAMDRLKAKIASDPEFAKRLGIDAGIWGEDGALTPQYRG